MAREPLGRRAVRRVRRVWYSSAVMLWVTGDGLVGEWRNWRSWRMGIVWGRGGYALQGR